MLKTLKLTIIGVLMSSLAFGQVVTRKDAQNPNQGKKPKKEIALKSAGDFQKKIQAMDKPERKTKGVIAFSEDFSGGSIPSTFTLYNQDGLTPAQQVSYVTDAWIANPNLLDSSDYTALSNSWYDPAGTADDWMVTPKITVPAGGNLSWNAIAYDGNFADGYEVLISTTDSLVGSFTTVLFSVPAENSVWTARNVSLSAYAGQDVFIAFRNNSNDKFLLAIDDIEIFQPDPYEIGVTNISEPNNDSGCMLTANENVTINIENFGADSIIGGFDVYYSINGNTPVVENITDTLLPGTNMDYTFTAAADMSNYQTYDIKAYTAYPQDNDQSNDTAYTSVVSADGQIQVKITTDDYPDEISWEILDQNNQVVAVSPVYDVEDTTYVTNICALQSDCYTFNIYDSYGDGIYSPGGYEVYFNSTLVDSSFTFSGAQASVYNIGNGCNANDLWVKAVFTLGEFPMDGGSPQEVQAIIMNRGSDDQTNAEVYLDITGANTYQDTITIPSLMSLEQDTITFTGFNPSSKGVNDVTVSVPADDNNANNSASYYQEVTDYTYNYADTAAIADGIGFNEDEGMMLAKFHVHGSKAVEAAMVNVSGSAAGNQLFGVLLDTSGNLLSTGQPVTIMPSDTNTYVELPIMPYNATDEDILVGCAQIANPNTGYFPLNTQTEDPGRADAFYIISGLAGGALTEVPGMGRWMIKGVIMDAISDDAILAGISEIETGCDITMKDVEINIYNNGKDTIMGLDAGYMVNNGSPVVETLTDTIVPGDTIQYTFSGQIDASAYGHYMVKAYVELTGDTLPSNDTAMTEFYNVEPTDVPYSTSFEMTDDNYAWKFLDGNNDGTAPSVIDAGSAAHHGTNLVFVPGGATKQDEYIVSRCLNLEAGKTYQLSFWHHAGSFLGMPIPENVQIVMGTSPDPASLTTLVADLGVVDVTTFTEVGVNFEVNTDDVYYIAFNVTTDQAYYYLIDDVSISDVTSVEEQVASNMKVYPNPTNDILNVEGSELNIQHIEVYNNMGQLVFADEVNRAQVQLNVADYKAGMYFIRMMTDQGIVTKKFQVNK